MREGVPAAAGAEPVDAILGRLLPEYPEDLSSAIRAEVVASGRSVIALDDDPTGVQTVSDVAVLVRPDAALLVEELRREPALAFVLTNSRSLPEAEAARLNTRIATDLLAASRATGRAVAIASRSDSTLRGHFPAETDALANALGGVDGVLVVPAFVEGGRLTIGDVHYVRDGDRLIPAAETEFARDPSFGYRASNLREWVAEKSGGRIPAAEVHSVSIADVREGGPDRVSAILAETSEGRPVVVNAASDRDLEVVALGVLRAEAAGRRLLYRTAASFLRARAGIARRPLLDRRELVGAGAPRGLAGLVVVGSHVRRTGEQLDQLLSLPNVEGIELDVPSLLLPETRAGAIRSAAAAADAALAHGATPVIATSRRVVAAGTDLDQLAVSRSVSAALVDTVRAMTETPGWIVAKGGITSSDVGTEALGARRSVVLGQVAAGVPVWRLGAETRFPGLAYVVFPGNVGGPGALGQVVAALRGDSSATG